MNLKESHEIKDDIHESIKNIRSTGAEKEQFPIGDVTINGSKYQIQVVITSEIGEFTN